MRKFALLFDSAHGWGVWTTCAAWKSLINWAALQWAAWFVLDYSQWLVDWLTASWSWLKAATLFRISFSLPRSGISDTLPWRVSGNSRLTRLCWSPSWGHTLPSYFTKEEKPRGEKTDMLRYYNIMQYYYTVRKLFKSFNMVLVRITDFSSAVLFTFFITVSKTSASLLGFYKKFTVFTNNNKRNKTNHNTFKWFITNFPPLSRCSGRDIPEYWEM